MNLGELVAETVDMVNDASITDALVRPALRDAARWAERNHSYLYMRSLITVTIEVPLGTDVPADIPLGNIKSILEEDGRVYQELDPRSRQLFRQLPYDSFASYRTCGWPSYFFIINNTTIRPAQIVSEVFKAELWVAKYSEWDKSNDALTHWLIDNAPDFLKYKACQFLSPGLRDPDFQSMCRNEAAEALKTTLDVDQEMVDGAKMETIGYAQDDLDDDL